MKPIISLQELAGRLMRCPAAPYHEFVVAGEVLQLCREHKLEAELDEFGNILVTLDRAPDQRPFALAAHLDHPGFEIRQRHLAGHYEAEFRGGVGDSYFKPGVKLRCYPGGTPARLGKRLETPKRVFEIESKEAQNPTFAVWDLPDFKLQKGRITGRACDDLIGAATILHVLISLAASKARVNVIGILSRAEEVGFQGALALAASGKLPKNTLLVSLETSREMPPVRMGEGVIIRVGDRASIFGSTETRFLAEVAADLARKNQKFKFQRALMSGGTCEATAYQEFAYACAAVCVALGNYHNCGEKDQIAAEFVSLADAENMSLLLQTAASELKNWGKFTQRLPKRLNSLLTTARKELKKQKLTSNR